MGLGCFTRHNMHNKPINSHLNVSTHSACNVQHGFRQEKNNWAHENRVKDVSRNVCFCQKAIRDVTNRLSEASIVTQGGIVTFRALCSQAIVLLSSNLYLSTSPLELSVAKKSYSVFQSVLDLSLLRNCFLADKVRTILRKFGLFVHLSLLHCEAGKV